MCRFVLVDEHGRQLDVATIEVTPQKDGVLVTNKWCVQDVLVFPAKSKKRRSQPLKRADSRLLPKDARLKVGKAMYAVTKN